jgi:quercetin dioxygenase-like cupin family protein
VCHTGPKTKIVVQGCDTLIINGERIPVKAGEKCFILRGVPHSGEVLAGTRTIHAFGGQRVART